ncbi:hypothetical protein BH18ACT5_BH18ACT5_19800 [soil metagenome]
MSERVRLMIALALVALLAGGWYWLQSADEPAVATFGELGAAKAALEAWGSWASDGDLAHLESTFADGPQLAQIRKEDASIVPGEAYEFFLVDGEVIEPGVVRGMVVLNRPGEAEQRFRWDLELVQVDGEWRLWTVRTSPQ